MSENWADKLIIQYGQARDELKNMKDKLGDSELDKMDKKQINSMINELSTVIKWLKTGKDPYDRRGNDKRSAYQKRALLNMDMFPSLDIVPDSIRSVEEKKLTNDDKEVIAEILLVLSEGERECYLLHHVNLLTFKQISKELNLSRGAVQSYIERARLKIKKKASCLTDAV